jgi:hypothetical protein
MVVCAIAASAVAATVLVACGSAGTTATTSPRQTASPSATPTPVSLRLPTTLYAGDSHTFGARLAAPTSPAKVTLRDALARSVPNMSFKLTGSVPANVIVPGGFYQGRPIRGLTCWVVVYTSSKPFNGSLGGPAPQTTWPSAAPAPPRNVVMVQHSVIILDARTGRFVRGFFTK